MINVILTSRLLLMREGLKHILKGYPDINVVDETENVECNCANNTIHDKDNNVAIVASEFVGDETEAVCNCLLQRFPSVKIIVITQNDCLSEIVSALRMGVRGLLSVGFSPHLLADAVRAVSRGNVFLNDEISGVLAKNQTGFPPNWSNKVLTPREADVFARLANGERASVIALSLGISIKTVSTHKTRIMDKLHLKNEAELVHRAIKEDLLNVSRPNYPMLPRSG